MEKLSFPIRSEVGNFDNMKSLDRAIDAANEFRKTTFTIYPYWNRKHQEEWETIYQKLQRLKQSVKE